jgi:integration host factor subunit beta
VRSPFLSHLHLHVSFFYLRGPPMTKSDLIMALAKKENLPDKKAAEAVNLIFRGFIDTLRHGGRIDLRGFWTFCVRNYKPYIGMNPKTRKVVVVKPKRAPFFKVGKELKERVDR